MPPAAQARLAPTAFAAPAPRAPSAFTWPAAAPRPTAPAQPVRPGLARLLRAAPRSGSALCLLDTMAQARRPRASHSVRLALRALAAVTWASTCPPSTQLAPPALRTAWLLARVHAAPARQPVRLASSLMAAAGQAAAHAPTARAAASAAAPARCNARSAPPQLVPRAITWQAAASHPRAAAPPAAAARTAPPTRRAARPAHPPALPART